jgi:hypothetical protein
MSVDNSTQTNPQSSAQTTPDTSYAGVTIPENQTPVNPAAAAAPTAAPTVAPNPAGQPPAANEPPSPHNDHVAMFDKILRMVNPGQTYVDPTGKQQVVRNRASLGNSVIASVLAGMMTPTKYREGTYGPVVSGDATAAAAYGAGKEQQTAQNEKLQATSDEMQAKKLSVVKNNIDTMHQYAALAQQQHQELQGVADRNNATILKDLSDYDSKQDDPAQKLIKGKGLTLEQAMTMTKGKMSSQNMVIDGYQDITDANGRTSVQPTYAVINPDAKVNMSESSAAELAKFKPAYKNAYDLTGGNIRVPVGQYLSDINLANSAGNLEAFMKRNDDALEALGIKSKDVDVAAASRSNPRVRQSLMEAENALAQGGEMYQVLDRLQKSPDGATLLTAMGINPDKAAKYVTEQQLKQTSAEALAKEGGQGEKSPADPAQVKGLVDSITSNPDLTESDKKTLLVDVPSPDKDGNVHMNKAQVEKLTARTDTVVASNKSLAEKKALADGDPAQMAKTASHIIEGSVDDITKLASMRGNARENAQNALEDMATARGLDPTDYSAAAMTAKADAVKSYSAAGKVGQQIASFNTFMGHEAEAADANAAWQRMNSPLLNRPMAWIAKNAADDPNFVRLQAALGAPAKEYMSFLNANRAEHEADIKQMETVLSPESTPLQINEALKELAKTADFRLASLGKGYVSTVGTTPQRLLDPAAAGTMQKFGIPSQSAKVSVPLPKGWAAGKPQQMVDKNLAKAYYQAAGEDKAQAVSLAKKNGWILQ